MSAIAALCYTAGSFVTVGMTEDQRGDPGHSAAFEAGQVCPPNTTAASCAADEVSRALDEAIVEDIIATKRITKALQSLFPKDATTVEPDFALRLLAKVLYGTSMLFYQGETLAKTANVAAQVISRVTSTEIT